MTEQNPAMTRFDRVMAALEHPTQHSSEQGYPEPDWSEGCELLPTPARRPIMTSDGRFQFHDGRWYRIDTDGRCRALSTT